MARKIYFAGSIRGGRADAELYKRMISHIQLTDIVLTEHVGDLNLSKHEKSLNMEAAIYEQDMAWLSDSDLVIAECTTPSLGVGYELAYAEKLGKRVHVFYNEKRTSLSAMISGNGYFNIHPYSSEDKIYPVLDMLLK
ncbi:MAG: nucleoside 2-deoxyribosyltransferase [Bacteroidales bacterium]|nr:nucleoside 2-deoxyribosyltransferase [Bacteroidales bacterium]